MTPREIQFWQKVSADLGIEVVTPVEIALSNGVSIILSALVKNFGADRGMVVDEKSDLIHPHIKNLVDMGYGFSSFGSSPDSYDRNSMIEVLADWGWSGRPEEKPAWLP